MGLAISSSYSESSHRSWNSAEATTVIFFNATQQPCRTVWLSHAGTPRVYKVLQPGEAYRQPTFTSHPWCFEVHCGRDPPPESSSNPGDSHDDEPPQLVAGDQAIFYAPPLQHIDAQPPIISIRQASLVPWSPEAHACFPAAFRAATLSLLMAHHRLSGTAEAAAESSAQSLGCAGAGKAHQLGSLVRRLCCCDRARARGRGADHASGRGRTGLELGDEATSLTLGGLPAELILSIIASSCPSLPLLRKPPLPHGVPLDALSPELRAALFS